MDDLDILDITNNYYKSFLINPVDHYGFGGPYSKKVFRLYVY